MLGIVGLIAAAGVVTWWVVHRTGSLAGADDAAAAAQQGDGRQATGPGQTGPASQAGTGAPGAQAGAGAAGGARAPAGPTVVYPAAVSAEVAALINRLSEFGAQGAQQDLARRGAAVLPELLAALRSIADQQDALPDTASDQLSQLERQKLQLIPVIAGLGGREAVPVLIEVARRSRPNSLAFIQTSDALDMMGATAEANQFAAELAARPDASKAMLVAIFTRYAYREAPPAVVETAARWVDPSADWRVRNPALRVLSSAGRSTEVTNAYRAIAQNPSTVDFRILSAAAESVRPAEFRQLMAGVQVSPYYRRAALEQNEFRWASAGQKTEGAERLLHYRDLDEAQAAALRYFLENNDTASLTRLQVAGFRGDPPQLWVRGDYKMIMARIGYRLEQAGTGITIVRQ